MSQWKMSFLEVILKERSRIIEKSFQDVKARNILGWCQGSLHSTGIFWPLAVVKLNKVKHWRGNDSTVVRVRFMDSFALLSSNSFNQKGAMAFVLRLLHYNLMTVIHSHVWATSFLSCKESLITVFVFITSAEEVVSSVLFVCIRITHHVST